MIIAAPNLLLVALLLTILTIVVGTMRRLILPRRTSICLILGMFLVSLAGGGLSVRRPDPRQALVLIDLSPSTRTAEFRDPAARDARIRQLLGDVRYIVDQFDDGGQIEQTRYPAPAADAVVLFSDAQFELPAAASPTYVVVDPKLEKPADASVTRVEINGTTLIANLTNQGGPRGVQFSGAAGPTTVPSGSSILTADLEPSATIATARVDPGDPWPENDSLAIRIPSRRNGETWWVSESEWPANFRAMRPSELPTDPAAYLLPAVIVLSNVPATAIPVTQQHRLMQYARDLGGGLVILGGDQSFAAGGYLGTELDTLSPLASAPPGPQRSWIVLADSSGSMASPVDGQTRWQRAAATVTQVLSALPPNDPVSVGSFARDVRWWSQGMRATDAARQPIPQDITPSGPTNIQPILTALATQLPRGTTTEIILITDADAAIDDPQQLALALRSVRASVNLLLTGQNPRAPLLQVVALTAGSMIPQADPSLWAQDAVKLVKSTMRNYLESRPTPITFTGPLSQLPARNVAVWNRTWIKAGATEIAFTQENNASIAMGGHRRLGAGQVAAVAFASEGSEAQSLAQLVEQAPRDPRFIVTHTSDENLTIRVIAVEGERFLNDLTLSAAIIDESEASRSPQRYALNQTAPGRYETSIPAPRTPSLAIIRTADQIIDRFAVAGRYAPEFSHIGNNHDAMNELAAKTGGAVIEPSQSTPIDFRWPARIVPLASVLAITGAGLIAIGLIFWKMQY